MFDWLNRKILARLPSRRLAATVTEVSAEGLRVRTAGHERLVEWCSINRVTAAAAAQMVGGPHILVLGLRSGDALTVTEAEPVWRGLGESLHLHLPGARRAAMWQLELAGGAEQAEVYRH